MRSLYDAGHALYAPLTEEEYRPFISLVERMLDAQAVELVVVTDEQVTVYDAEGTFALTASPGEDGRRRPPEAYVRVRPGLASHLAVIGRGGEVRGVLVAYREQAFSQSERSLLDALASQVFVRLENLRLFSEIVEQRTQLADIIGHTSDGIFVVSPEREVLSWNPAMEKITAVAAGEAIGRTVDEVLGFSESEVASLMGGGAGGRGGASVRDILLVRADGTQRWVRYARNPIQDRDGALKGYVLVARDVTADVEAEQLKADFVATVSHELRTPLTPLKGFLSSLLQGTVDDSPSAREEYYRIMLNQANRLERLITDLLEVSRIESGKQVVDMAPVELTPLVAESARDLSTEEARIVLRTPKDPVFVRADPFRVGQVLTNLLSNALKYSPPDAPVEVTVSREAEQAIVSVQDHGEGIPESEQDRVFERFHRVDSGSTRRTGGTGLGLYIAKRLVEAMAGRLWLTSRPGEGSTFSFSLPLAETGALFPQLSEPVTGTDQPQSELPRLP
jgi:PAS domain S-box-containing protein